MIQTRYITLIGTVVLTAMSLSCSPENIPEEKDPSTDTEIPADPDTPFTPPTIIPRIIQDRALWASVNTKTDASAKVFSKENNKVLISWRMFPTDENGCGFDLYRESSEGLKQKLNEKPITSATCWQDTDADLSTDNTYYLHYSGEKEYITSYTLKGEALPYISIPLVSTSDVSSWIYDGNDASVGDLDGDGQYEIVIKRMARIETENEEDDAHITPSELHHINLFEAYELNGRLMWRIKSGPNIPLGNSASFAVSDFDGDGKAEVALRTAEGTVFGDGKEIKDTNVDGKTDYRHPGSRYTHGGPEFLSVVDGKTGKEIDRVDYIALGKSIDWGDDRYHRSSSYRIGAGNFSGGCPSIVIGRGCYGKIVVEAWDFYDGKLYKRWNFDTTANNNEYASYEAQGYHSFRSADVDNDGFDEVVYGSCTIDHNGKGLNCCGLGHGDAIHVGAFDSARPNDLLIWACYETGDVGAALREGHSGNVIWQYNDPSDIGRAMTADIDPTSPGYEMWWFRGNVHSLTGKDLGYTAPSCNFAVWWTGSLNRQVLNGTVIDQYDADAQKWQRAFTLYRYDVMSVNGTKENPCFCGDFLGDWREEVILLSSDGSEMRVFSTWYKTNHKFPYLMSDPTYNMSAVNQNIGYNQPTHLGYYLGSDLP